MMSLITSILSSALRSSVPLILASTGGAFSIRSAFCGFSSTNTSVSSGPSAFASVLTLSVFARPGTPSRRMCPPVTIARISRSISFSCPPITFATSSRILVTSSACAEILFVASLRSMLPPLSIKRIF